MDIHFNLSFFYETVGIFSELQIDSWMDSNRRNRAADLYITYVET